MRFKGLPPDLRQFLTIKSPLEMMKNVLYFMLKALFVFKIFRGSLENLNVNETEINTSMRPTLKSESHLPKRIVLFASMKAL